MKIFGYKYNRAVGLVSVGFGYKYNAVGLVSVGDAAPRFYGYIAQSTGGQGQVEADALHDAMTKAQPFAIAATPLSTAELSDLVTAIERTYPQLIAAESPRKPRRR